MTNKLLKYLRLAEQGVGAGTVARMIDRHIGKDIETLVGEWVNECCCCWSCVHGIDRNLFGQVFCEQPGMAGGWNRESAQCEEHDFRSPQLLQMHQRIMDVYYEAHEHEFNIT